MSTSRECVVLCPGQGAQAVGMGQAWSASVPEAAAVMTQADRILDEVLGTSLSGRCFEGPAEDLNRTDISQPAILACSVACWHGLQASGVETTAVAAAGLSLGEYTALHLAGVLSFEDALRTVAARGRLMQEAAETSDGGMVAVMGEADESLIRSFCDDVLKTQPDGAVLVPANFNAPGQIVLSGSREACEAAVGLAGDAGFRAKSLTVAGAFHSPLMQPAADRMAEVLDDIDFQPPAVPVWSNVTASPHGDDVSEIKQRLVDQITHPVRWSPSMTSMIDQGYRSFREVAPGKVLKGLMKRIDRKVEVQNHDVPDPSLQA